MQISVFVCIHVCVCARACVYMCAVEVTWEDQQRGLNGSLSDGGTQPHLSLTETGWLVWVWISDTSKAIFHFYSVLDFFVQSII